MVCSVLYFRELKSTDKMQYPHTQANKCCSVLTSILLLLLLLLLLFPHISPISRTRGHRRRLPFPYHRYIHPKKNKQKKRKRGKKITDEKTSPDLIGGEGKKIKQEQKNKSKDPPRISERQTDKQARQTKCQDHTTVDTVRESLAHYVVCIMPTSQVLLHTNCTNDNLYVVVVGKERCVLH